MRESRDYFKDELILIHERALVKLYRLRKRALKKGLKDLAQEMLEEAWALDGNISYSRFFEEDYSFIQIWL